MKLIDAVIQRVQSKESISGKKYGSPPPELADDEIVSRAHPNKKKKITDRYGHVPTKVDTSPPPLVPADMFRNLEDWRHRLVNTYRDNVKLLMFIKRHHFTRGMVDCRWVQYPRPSFVRFEIRRDALRRIEADNRHFYQRLAATIPRVATAQSLEREWRHNRRSMIHMAELPFVLFPPVPREDIPEIFLPPPGFKRPRVRMSLRIEKGASLGTLTMELFTDMCPQTCRLFLELARGDGLGHGYKGTCFFRKVPHLYWSGGDVIYDTGFGCYAQVGRAVPIGAENYHYPHSMPGLLSMRMTRDDEMCGIFNITFKALPQFDLKNVVFGRVILPSATYETMRSIGSALSTQPVVRVTAVEAPPDPPKWEQASGIDLNE